MRFAHLILSKRGKDGQINRQLAPLLSLLLERPARAERSFERPFRQPLLRGGIILQIRIPERQRRRQDQRLLLLIQRPLNTNPAGEDHVVAIFEDQQIRVGRLGMIERYPAIGRL